MGIQNDVKGITLRRRHLILYTMITSIVAAVVTTPTAAAAATAAAAHTEAPAESDLQAQPAIPYCAEQQERRIGRRLLYITTLDGRLNALDIAQSGKLRWSIETGPGPLISSSIHRLELTNNGQFVRMIPSLSGGIYKFDGDSIDPIPITAEHLLSSSAKFSEDLVISGGKETRNYGVSVRTGQLLYECSINGCVNSTNDGRAINDTIEELDKDDEHYQEHDEQLRDDDGYIIPHDSQLDDVIVVRRQTQTVRAVESRTGIERWNFSVGQHELDVMRPVDCQEQPRNDLELAVLDVDIRVVVPEGIICAFSKSDPQLLLWKHQFNHPIVSAWQTNAADELQSIDLFSSAQWLWEQDEQEQQQTKGKQPSNTPAIYLGMYEKQLYIQESIRLRREIMDQTQLYQQLTGDTSLMPKIPWRPIAASSNSLVIFQGDHNAVVIQDGHENNELMPYDDQNFAVAAQSVLNASEFVNGNGFYFYMDAQWDKSNVALECDTKGTDSGLPAIEASNASNETVAGTGNHSINDDLGFSLDDIDAPVKLVILSLWFWWKEIVVIAFTSAVLLNMFMGHRNQRVEREYLVIERHVPVQTAIEATEASTQALLGPVVPLNGSHHQHHHHQQHQQRGNRSSFTAGTQRSISESTTNSGEHFTSRFQTDFELMQCLGRGGFGVVFEAKNKLDENHYAIKRITLPNKELSRQRVLREARTLASCEHHNIVRYFHSWVETPPVGWQEEEDRKLLAHEMSTSIQIETPDGSTMPSLLEHTQHKRNQLISWVSDTANSTACSYEPGHGDSSFNRIMPDYDDGEDDSLVEFRSESQSAALHADEEVAEEDQQQQQQQRPLQRNSVSIDIHSASFDLKNINYTQHQLSNSFQIESVRSKHNASDTDDDSDAPPARPKPLTLALAHNHNHNQQTNSSQITPPSATIQNGYTVKPNKVYLYIQMQLCRKDSLRDWLRDNRTDARASQIAYIFHQIVDAVDYVHVKGLIHRDLKPSNIFFSQDGQIKIGDFGLVTDMADIPNILNDCGDQSGLPSCARHTQQVGTHLYMSPEQLRGQHYDYKVDIYSLGLIFFELHVYFSTEMERIKTLRALRDGQYPADFIGQYPQQYALLQKMLCSQPTQRPQTKQLKQELHDILHLPDHLVDERCLVAALLHRNRTFSSSSEQPQ